MSRSKKAPIFKNKKAYKSYKEIVLDYKNDANDAKDDYLTLIKGSGYKNDKFLIKLADYILQGKMEDGINFLNEKLKANKINIKQITLKSAKKRLKKGKKLIHSKKSKKTIFVPENFSDRDHFYQLMLLQHKYKLFSARNSKKLTKNIKKEILETSLSLVVLAIKSGVPNYLTENFYKRYKLSLEEF